MIVVDNNFIKNKILASVALLEAIPALKSYKSQIAAIEKDCGSCGGGASATKKLHDKWNELRQTLVNLPEDKRALIRDRVSSGSKLRVSYRTGSGKQTRYPGGFI